MANKRMEKKNIKQKKIVFSLIRCRHATPKYKDMLFNNERCFLPVIQMYLYAKKNNNLYFYII